MLFCLLPNTKDGSVDFSLHKVKHFSNVQRLSVFACFFLCLCFWCDDNDDEDDYDNDDDEDDDNDIRLFCCCLAIRQWLGPTVGGTVGNSTAEFSSNSWTFLCFRCHCVALNLAVS